jgi:hypothetical protein
VSALLPSEGASVEDYLASLTVLADRLLEKRQSTTVNTAMQLPDNIPWR